MDSLDCLAQTIYWEARGESATGRAAVAHVVLNRAEQWKRPICSIVYAPSQFSWTKYVQKSPFGNSWITAKQLASNVLQEQIEDPTRGALYFHSTAVNPYWAPKKKFLIQIGNHKFYK